MTGKFITVEGIEGVGKTTNIDFIQQMLQAAGHAVVLTREPGGTPLGEAIRGLLLDPHYTGMDTVCELQLMFAARAEHLAKVILPALQAGKNVIVLAQTVNGAAAADSGTADGPPEPD